LEFAKDAEVIDSMLMAWLARKDIQTRPDTPLDNEWLVEFAKRLDYCCSKLHQSSDNLDFRDLIVRAVLLNGIPAEHDIEDTDTSEIHYLVFRTGARFGFERPLGSGKPWKMIPHMDYQETSGNRQRARNLRKPDQKRKPNLLTEDERIFLSPKIKKVIAPTFALASFSNYDGTYSVWAASAVHADQVKADDTKQVSIVRRAVLYRNFGDVPKVAAIDSARLTFNAADEREHTLYPFCWSQKLEEGGYNYTLAVYDDNGGLGIITHGFSVPSSLASKGISDILLTQGFAERDYGGTANRVLRDGWSMKGNSYPVYHSGDTLYFYAEANFAAAKFEADRNGNYQYRVYCNLLPVDKSRREGTTRTEESYMLRDSIDARNVEKIIRERDQKSRTEKNLIYSRSRSSRETRTPIHDGAPLANIPKGEYYLVLRVDDAQSPASLIALKTVFIK
ncbi:MAG: hypothetical protein WBP29_10345, partial [Candidatus Zixiibacteriota bacterium]